MEKPEQPTVEVKRDEQTKKLVEFMDKVHAKEVFGNSETKIEFIKNASFEQFQELLFTVNGLMRDIPRPERGADGDTVALMAQEGTMLKAIGLDQVHYPPRQADKEDLLREMFELAKKTAENGNLEDVALLSAAGINAIHEFMDGNGRTSRLIYFLLTEDYSGSEEQVDRLKKIMGEEGRLYINIDPGLVEPEISNYLVTNELELDSDDVTAPQTLNISSRQGNLKKLLDERVPKGILADFKRYILKDDYGFFAVYKFLKDQNRLAEFTKPFEEEGKLVCTDLFVADLVRGLEAEDYNQILEIYWQLKKKGVSILLNAIVDPQRYVLQPGRYSVKESQTLKAALVGYIDEEYEKSWQEVNCQDISSVWEKKDVFPFSEKTFSVEDLQQLREINKTLEAFADEDAEARQGLVFDVERAQTELSMRRKEIRDMDRKTSPEVMSAEGKRKTFELEQSLFKPLLELSRNQLDQIISYLDGLGIWKNKFTTRNPERHLTEEEQGLTDSIYYVTGTGQSLRLKKFELLKGGLKGAIQPFMEQIFFMNEEKEASDEPKEGMGVIEYFTDEFLDAQKEDSTQVDFKSKIRRYDEDGKIIYLNPVDGLLHRGYKVNKVL